MPCCGQGTRGSPQDACFDVVMVDAMEDVLFRKKHAHVSPVRD